MNVSSRIPPFEDPALASSVESLDEYEVDSLPYGAIHLDDAGVVRYFSDMERQLSGFGDTTTIGKHFFTDIAPCMDNPDFRGRVERALAAGSLDIEFTYFGDFCDGDREMTVRIQSGSKRGYWIFMRREA